MRKIWGIAFVLCLIWTAAPGLGQAAASAAVKKISLQFPDIIKQVETGSQLHLAASSKPKVKITYRSADAKVATVNGQGIVTGTSPGHVRITAAVAQKGYTGQASAIVTVLPKPAPKPGLDERDVPAATDYNSANGSYLVRKESFLYYIEPKQARYVGGPIYRMQADDPSTRKLLHDGNAQGLATQGDWLYFIENQQVYKIKTDGSSYTKLTDDSYRGVPARGAITIAGNWIYYGSNGKINRVLTDGSKDQTVFDDPAMLDSFFISNGWIYYLSYDRNEKYGIKKAKIGETRSQFVAYADTFRMVVKDDWIYFYESGKGPQRMRTDGTGKMALDVSYDFVLHDDSIYFTQYGDQGMSMYRSNPDGTGLERLAPVDGGYPIIAGDRIYYLDNQDDGLILSMKITGGDLHALDGRPLAVRSREQLLEAQKEGAVYVIPAEYESLRKYEQALAKARALIEQMIQPGMTDDQKLKAVHDYIVLNTGYDYDNYLKDTIPEDSYYEYGVLVNRIAVCNGYALTLKMFMDLLGIENYFVTGDIVWGGSHAWNVVKIDGKYYQVDTTWDDPVPDQTGRLRYDYYKITDAQMSESRTWDRSQAPATN